MSPLAAAAIWAVAFLVGLALGRLAWGRGPRGAPGEELPRCQAVAAGVQRRCELRKHEGPHLLHDDDGVEVWFRDGDELAFYSKRTGKSVR